MRVRVIRGEHSIEVQVTLETDSHLLEELQAVMLKAGIKATRQGPLRLDARSTESTMVLAERTERWLRRKGHLVAAEER